MKKPIDLQIILPAFNEEKSLPQVIAEIAEILKKNRQLRWQIIISEDGSTDNTKLVLKNLAKKYPLKLILSQKRKGYSLAIIDAFKLSTAPYILTMDSDGQCDPHDILKAWSLRHKSDVVIGWRQNRQDHLQRKLFSNGFKLLHKLLFGTYIHDPSCPLVLINRKSLIKLIPALGILNQGFWWEFTAQVIQTGISMSEFSIRHRERIDGKTRVYTLSNLPIIAWTHTTGLFKIKLTQAKFPKFSSIYKSPGLGLLFLNSLWLLRDGYNCVRSDCHYYYLPIIQYFQKGILANDIFIQFSTNKPFLFYQLVAIISRFLNLNLILFGIVFLSNFLYLYSLYKLSMLLFKNEIVAYLSVFLGMYVTSGTLAYDYPQFVAHAMTFMTPLLFLCIWLFFEGKTYLSFLLAGILTNFHPVSGVLTGFLLGLLFLSNKNNLSLQKMSISLGLFLFPTLPIIINVYQTQIQNLDPTTVISWLAIVQIRSPHHLFPSLWPLTDYFIFGTYWFVVLVGFYKAFHYLKKEHCNYYIFSIIGTLLFLTFATVLIEVFPIKPIIQLTPFRILVFLKYLSLPLIAYLIYSYIIGNKIFQTKVLQFLTFLLIIQVLTSLFRNDPAHLDIFGKTDLAGSKRQISRWISKNTPVSAVLITPPYETGFRTDTQRAIVGDWKSGGLAIWDIEYAQLWWQRITDLSNNQLIKCLDYAQCLENLQAGYESLNEMEIKNLSQKYAAEFFVSHNLKLTFPIVYQNKDYAVYELSPSNTRL